MPFARIRFPGRDFLFIVLIATIMLPGVVRLIPTYLMYRELGFLNTYLPMVLPAFFGSPLFHFPAAAVFPHLSRGTCRRSPHGWRVGDRYSLSDFHADVRTSPGRHYHFCVCKVSGTTSWIP